MSDFENELRSRLREAAGHAPVFSGLTLDHEDRPPTSTAAAAPDPVAPATSPYGERKPRHPVRWMAAAAAVTIVAGGAWWTTGRHIGRTPEQASCPSEVVADGSVYVANGDLVRVPRPGPRLTGMSVTRTPCGAALGDPGEPVTAFRVSGVDPTVAFLADGKVWSNARFSSLPPELRHLYVPVRCTRDGQRTFVGQLTGSDARVTEDYHPLPPYTATFVAEEGPGLGLDRYSTVTVQLRVTSATDKGADPQFLRQALGNGERAQVEVDCDGSTFVATAFAPR